MQKLGFEHRHAVAFAAKLAYKLCHTRSQHPFSSLRSASSAATLLRPQWKSPSPGRPHPAAPRRASPRTTSTGDGRPGNINKTARARRRRRRLHAGHHWSARRQLINSLERAERRGLGGRRTRNDAYKGTVRGDQQKQPHRFRAELKALDAPFVTLKLLSRKGDARTLSIDSLEIVVDAAAPAPAAPPPPPARAAATASAAASSSHQKTLLAGAALLDAAERRLTAHVDAACARVQRHLGAKLDAQGAALARLEAAVARLGTRPPPAAGRRAAGRRRRRGAAPATRRHPAHPAAADDGAVGAALKKTTVRCGDHAMTLFVRAPDSTLAPPANGEDADGTGLELWGGGRYLANF